MFTYSIFDKMNMNTSLNAKIPKYKIYIIFEGQRNLKKGHTAYAYNLLYDMVNGKLRNRENTSIILKNLIAWIIVTK